MEISKLSASANHCLHLCNNSNIEEIIFSYLIDADAFVTNDIESWTEKFNANKVNCQIKKPNLVNKNEKIVVDGASLGNEIGNWEEKWKKQCKAVCIYNIERLDPSILKNLVDKHDKMFLSADNLRMVSDKNLETEMEDFNPEIVENLIKKELKNVILSMLLSNPMSGTDLVKILYQKFRVFISPGMLYPTLHELEKKGLLKYEYKLKNKVYSVQEKEQAKILLKTHVRVNSLLSQFLVNE